MDSFVCIYVHKFVYGLKKKEKYVIKQLKAISKILCSLTTLLHCIFLTLLLIQCFPKRTVQII